MDQVEDKSNDPSFDGIPTWGICRPTLRKSIDPGDWLFFVGYFNKTKEYLLKGYFSVGEKIPYNEALARFPNQQNVIISKVEIKKAEIEWRYKKLEKAYKKEYNDTIPKWLTAIVVKEGTYYQNLNDNHEIDNWKCRRIFHCNKRQFSDCISSNRCINDGSQLKDYSNYIVADPEHHLDIGRLRISFDSLKKVTGFKKNIITPMHQHNVLRCDEFHDQFIDFFKSKNQ